MVRVVGRSGVVLTVSEDTAAALLLDGSVKVVEDRPAAKKAAAKPSPKK